MVVLRVAPALDFDLPRGVRLRPLLRLPAAGTLRGPGRPVRRRHFRRLRGPERSRLRGLGRACSVRFAGWHGLGWCRLGDLNFAAFQFTDALLLLSFDVDIAISLMASTTHFSLLYTEVEGSVAHPLASFGAGIHDELAKSFSLCQLDSGHVLDVSVPLVSKSALAR